MKKILKWAGGILLLLLVVGATLYWIYLRPFIQKMKVETILQYDKELTLVTGGGGNSGILTSDSLVIVIDTKMDDAAKNLFNRVKQLAGNKPILVVNTHIHPDHVGGNYLYTGATILAGGSYTKEQWTKEAGQESLPNAWLMDRKDIKMGDDTVTLLNLAHHVHTESDVMVYLHKRKLLFGGDVILNKQNPIIMDNGKAEGYLWAFDFVTKKFDVKQVVPGHGPVGGKEVLDNFKTYFNDMKTAAIDNSQRNALVSKYEDWGSIPVFMSPGATISAFKKENSK